MAIACVHFIFTFSVSCSPIIFRQETVERSLHRARGTVIDEAAFQTMKESIEALLHEFRKEDIENNGNFVNNDQLG